MSPPAGAPAAAVPEAAAAGADKWEEGSL